MLIIEMPKEDCCHSAMQRSDLCFAYMGNVTSYNTIGKMPRYKYYQSWCVLGID